MRITDTSSLDFNLAGATDPAAVKVVHVESAQPDDMQVRVAEALADPSVATMNLCYADIAGAGDGHAFVTRLMFADAQNSTGLLPAVVRILFYMAEQAQAIQVARREKQAEIAALITGGVAQVALRQTGLAGAQQGTRFMGMLLIDLTQPGPG